MSAPKSITGRTRLRKTKWTVLWIDRAAKIFIAAGGIGTIIAVATVFVFLTSVALWLFVPAQIGNARQVAVKIDSPPLYLACDEFGTTGWMISAEGAMTVFRMDNGQTLSKRALFEDMDAKLTSAAFQVDGEHGAFGFDDGSIRLGRIAFTNDYLAVEDVPPPLRSLPRNEVADLEGAMVARVTDDRFRRSKLVVELDEKIEGKQPDPIVKIDSTILEHSDEKVVEVACTLTPEKTVNFIKVTKSRADAADDWAIQIKVSSVELPANRVDPPSFLLISGLGTEAYAAWSDGHLVRFDLHDFKKPVLVETVSLLTGPNEKLTDLKMLLGGTTLLAGDSTGRVRAWFSIKPDASRGESHMVAAHELAGPNSPVTSLAVNGQFRMCAASYGDGSTRLFFVTNERVLADVRREAAGPGTSVMIAPRGDALAVAGSSGLTLWSIDPRHPEVTLGSLFGKVWYEGYAEPCHAWQSSGPRDAEAKMSLVPLIFGTLKATLYSLLFGAPLALMAAIFTSEFMHPRAKARVKPVIEMMASLPSVVLGFLAGVIFAPLIEKIIPQVMTSFFTVPLFFMAGAHMWQFLPRNFALRHQRWKLACIAALLPAGVWFAWFLGPILEKQFFAEDIKAWLSNPEKYSNGIGGWLFLLLPAMGFLTALFVVRVVSPYVRRFTHNLSRQQLVLIDFLKFVGGIVLAVGLTLLVSAFLIHICGLDPRDPEPLKQHLGVRFYPLSTYATRNAMILGFMMGFAIIPIIYTVAEDALSSVPQHLRSASLGAGATPWQTAIRIVIPTAMSGLFSAVMIGLGRAVGETMIVLMAAGNTSIEEFNIFNGFQTLSAAIATELSEASQGGTLYRTLFLAGGALFMITFVLNTVAESVRIRFRRRAYEL